MEAVEVPISAAVEVKILNVEGFAAEKRESRDKGPVFGRFPVTTTSTVTDIPRRVNALEQSSVSRSKKADAGLCMFHNSLPSYVDEATALQDANMLFTGKQLQRKAGKAPKNSSFCLRRPNSEHVQGSISQAVFGHCHVPTGKHKSGLTESSFSERTLAVGQKLSLDGKRGDKRNFRPPTKTKVDHFFSKLGLANSSSSAGGGSILGIYGLKSDIHDVTKHVDELSLNDLLDGSYKYPSLCLDKGRRAANTNENLLHTINKACSILQPWKPVQSQTGAELDSSSNRKVDTGILSSGSSVASGTDTKGDDNCMADLASSSKESCTESATSPLYQPKDILERLALPPAKSLDAFLLDTSKPALSKGMNDLRISKPMPDGASLPPFPWSHCSSGLSKTTIDTVKLSSNKSRWVRIGSIVSSLQDASNFEELNSVPFDHKSSIKDSDALSFQNSAEFLLPQRCHGSFDWKLKLGLPVENLLIAPKLEQSKRRSNGDSSSSNGYSLFKCSVGGFDQYEGELHISEKLIHAGHSPRLLAAAQTLCEFAKHSAEENENIGKLRWLEKPSQKAMKARKPRSTGKTEVLPSIPRLVSGPTDPSETMNNSLPSKKPKYSTNNKKMDISRTNHVERGPIKWSIPTSSRSPPSRSENAEAKQLNSDSVKLGMMPSFKRGLDKTCDSKLRQAVSMDWGRGRS